VHQTIEQNIPILSRNERLHRFCLWILKTYFAPMRLGLLRVTAPNGETLEFGEGGSVQASIQIRSLDFFRKCFLYGDVGFGEAYVDGDWDTDDITRVISWMILNVENSAALSGSKRTVSWLNLLKPINRSMHLWRKNNLRGSKKNISDHYDLNNEFFATFLDPSMTYSSAYFAEPEMDLHAAQIAKYELLCRKLGLTSHDHVLEIGSGWGGFAIHAAKKYGCRITTVTISKQQYEYAQALISRENLTDRIELRLQDYRELSGKFDKIVSIEMLEAVGHEFLPVYFQKCQQLLTPSGLMALQVITCPDSRYESLRTGIDWTQKHIFPGSLLPSISAINDAINKTGNMFLCDLQDLTPHYAETLRSWRGHFQAKLNEVRSLGFTNKFVRKWNYYLSYCEAVFAMRNISVVQLLYTRPNNLTLSGGIQHDAANQIIFSQSARTCHS
jgi:cyclopropane-fatty-acyl-phospholipid synthase